jgi:hypothetical protein
MQQREGGVGFVFTGELPIVVDASLDPDGRVRALEVRETPRAWNYAKLKRERGLAFALGRGKAVRSVSVSRDGDVTRVKLGFVGGTSFVIDMGADFEHDESEGYGC